jgi:uncharacterized protein (TIGR01777 family)
MLNILITGGTGLIGQRITDLLLTKGYTVGVLSRAKNTIQNVKNFVWSEDSIDVKALEFADVIVHLAGANVGEKRWTKKRKKEIIRSRTQSAALIRTTLLKYNISIDAFISASAIGYYGEGGDEKLTEDTKTVTPDFLSDVCQQWEDEAALFGPICRFASIRIGFVIGKKSIGFLKLVQPIKIGFGAALGSGKQYMSWIHLDDLARVFVYVIENKKLQGAINAVSPTPETNAELSKKTALYLSKPFFMPNVPGFVLKLLLGEMGNLALVGNRVVPQKLVDNEFEFQFPTLESALDDVFPK